MSSTESDKHFRRYVLALMQNSVKILTYVLQGVSQETAVTLRDPNDGDNGWTILEAVCHLRDFDEIFRQRGHLMLDQMQPELPFYDHLALVEERSYNEQHLSEVLTALQKSREQTAVFFINLTDDEWERFGVHPEYGLWTMRDAALQVGAHDNVHLEQITRILADAS